MAAAAKGQLQVTGTFTMHGVAKTIVIPVTFNWHRPRHEARHGGGRVRGALKLKRSDFGIKTLAMIGPASATKWTSP